MEVVDYKRLNQLLSVEHTEKRCSLSKLSEVLNDFMFSPYYDPNKFNRGNMDEVLNQVEDIQAKERIFNEKVSEIKQSKRYREFVKKYKNGVSGYTMGERTIVTFTDGIKKSIEVISDNEKSYSGAKARTYNKNITYGLFELICDFSAKRNKYTEKIITK